VASSYYGNWPIAIIRRLRRQFRKEDNTMCSRRMLLITVALSAIAGFAGDAVAQTYPSRPVTMVVPFPAGGPTDTIGRIMAEGMRASLGQSVIIENVAGASGSIGTGRVARAPGDGYTISLGLWTTHVVNGAVFPLTYDVLNDFEPVCLMMNTPLLIVARKSMPAKTLQELIAWLKANPGKATEGTGGPGGASHVAGVYLQKETGTRFQFVAYRGVGPAMQDLVSGQIDMIIDLAGNSLPQVRAGTIKAFAVTDSKRLPAAPEIPTVDEAGVPGLHVSTWHAFYAPKGTPKPVIGTLNSAIVDALADPAVRRKLIDLGQAIYPREQQTPEALAAFHKAEIEKWWPMLKAAGIKAE
jgi:tripartite-type tricarboxylate transporter receptor subunit TctC